MSFDNPWQWSSTAASNTAITSIDITGTTGLVKNGDNAIRAIMAGWATVEAKGSDVASASTITLGSQRYYHVTGTTTITDIDFTDAVDGRWAWLIFDGALTLTHNSTTLKLPGGANIVTEAGDRALIIQDSGDNVICLQYQRALDSTYVTGTGTPGLTFGGGSTGMTFGATTAYFYIKRGRFVTGYGRLTLTAKGSSTGAAAFTSLPFTSANDANLRGSIVVQYYANMASMVGNPFGIITHNSTSASFNQMGASSMASLTHANFTDTSDIYFTFSYPSAS